MLLSEEVIEVLRKPFYVLTVLLSTIKKQDIVTTTVIEGQPKTEGEREKEREIERGYGREYRWCRGEISFFFVRRKRLDQGKDQDLIIPLLLPSSQPQMSDVSGPDTARDHSPSSGSQTLLFYIALRIKGDPK